MKRQYKIVEHYKIWFGGSIAVILVGLAFIFFRGFNLGIDFTGGTMMQIDFGKQIAVEEISKTISSYHLDPEIVHIGAEKKEVMIKTTKALDTAQRQEVFKALQDQYKLEKTALVGSEQFGPTVGKELQRSAMMSVAIASVAMLIYITIRFEFIFAVSAIVALFHDIIILISIYAIFQIPVNSPFIAAILTILGYSINDTIVVFDRIRENLHVRKKETPTEIANNSVNSTFGRSINTSVVTVAVITGLYIFGVESIKMFVLPLIAGISIGTFSSIFIASPMWALWKTSDEKKQKERELAERQSSK